MQWLVKNGLIDQAVTDRSMSPDPDYDPGFIVDQELAQGRLDVAILWGPIAGSRAARIPGAKPVLVQLHSRDDIRFEYSMALAVRRGEPKWKQKIDALLEANRERIAEMLKELHIPILDRHGDLIGE